MKKALPCLLLSLISAGAFCQVDINKSINLSGTAPGSARISGIKDVSNNQDAVSVEALQKGTFIYAAGTLSGGVYTVLLSPALTATPPAGTLVSFKANLANGGPVSVQLNALPAIPLKKNISVDLAANDIVAGQVVSAIYDGASFQLLAGLTPNSVIQNNTVNSNFASGQSASFDVTGNGEMNGNLSINGNVGIGKLAGSTKLDIFQGSAGTGLSPYYTYQLRTEHSGDGGFTLTTPQANAAYIYHNTPFDGASSGIKFDGAARYMSFFTVNGTERMRIDNVGNVGIGTTPLVKFHVKAGTNQNLWINPAVSMAGSVSIAAANDAGSANTPLEFRASKFDFEVGNVGIGTPSPGSKLEVSDGTAIMRITQTDHATSSTLALRSNVAGRLAGDMWTEQAVITNGGGTTSHYEVGDLVFSGRNLVTDAGLTERMRLSAGGKLTVDGVEHLNWSGYIQGNQTLSVSFTHNGQSSFEITCVTNHYGYIRDYGAARKSLVANHVDGTIDIIDMVNVTSVNGGSWSYTRSGNTVTITKNAGAYVGGGYYFITVAGSNNLNKL